MLNPVPVVLNVRQSFWFTLAVALLAPLTSAFAQPAQPTFNLDDLGVAVEEWARENLDENVLAALGGADRKRTDYLFKEFTSRLQSENVYDLAPLMDTATTLLPVLEGLEEAKPYASWLRTHLDYLLVSDELKRTAPSPQPGQTSPNPPADAQRTVWDQQLAKRPLPARAKTHVPRLKPIFSAQGTPPALVWLAEVESSFDPGARSPAGAVGMFQFMAPTARAQGLSLSPRDERLDPDKSARAAAKYLRYLYGRFGDWRLALAAYNAGETRVHNLLTRYKTRSYSVISTRLPAETQLYVPKIEATVGKREGVTLASLRLPPS
jgi:membrane-bound lytic murein transglycosylase D